MVTKTRDGAIGIVWRFLILSSVLLAVRKQLDRLARIVSITAILKVSI